MSNQKMYLLQEQLNAVPLDPPVVYLNKTDLKAALEQKWDEGYRWNEDEQPIEREHVLEHDYLTDDEHENVIHVWTYIIGEEN